MKPTILLYIIFITLWLSITSCGVDNYAAPDAKISGSVINDMTNKPIQTKQPNGIRISLTQIDYSNKRVPLYSWVKANGIYKNTKVFSGKYKVVPVEGPFFTADTQNVDIEGETKLDFKVTPYLTIVVEDSASNSSSGVITKYSITRSKTKGKILSCETIASVSPRISHSLFDKAITHDLSNMNDSKVLSTQFTDTLRGLKSGKTYYIRVAAIADNALNRYNYSPIMKIKIP